MLLQRRNRLSARSLPNGSLNPDSPLALDLQLGGSTVTGTWPEQTARPVTHAPSQVTGRLWGVGTVGLIQIVAQHL